ncbi:MAG TPA: hypothetical protein PLB11_08110 [Flavobacterium sp.]|nr:hypothetical protein [Flavobacterium sp.]
MTIGLVTEGITDQEIISNILYGYFNDDDILINELQPLRDETDKSKAENIGGWGNLIEYCKSEVFKKSFQIIDILILQVDTDICEEYGVPKKEAGIDLTPEQLVEKVKLKFIDIIGEDFYKNFSDKIIFAISVHSIECWLLPIYYTDNKKSKMVNCLGTLNSKLNIVEGFTIDENNKNFTYYEKISKIYSKRKKLILYYKLNPSFKIFIDDLENLFNAF